MCEYGMNASTASPGRMRWNPMLPAWIWLVMLKCEVMTPFGSPVVPDE
jgi:hypothetical protein